MSVQDNSVCITVHMRQTCTWDSGRMDFGQSHFKILGRETNERKSALATGWNNVKRKRERERSRGMNGRRCKGEDVDECCLWGGGADCVWEGRLIPRSILTAAAPYRWGWGDAETHTHTHTHTLIHTHTHTQAYCVSLWGKRKKHCQMLDPFSNTLEDHAKHKVGVLWSSSIISHSAVATEAVSPAD